MCNGAVNFIIDRDREAQFRFAALQSEAGRDLVRDLSVPVKELESMVWIEGGRAYTRSTAALRIARRLPGLWPLFYVFIVVPTFLRDGAYDLIARNRYQWFGKRETCRVPTPEVRARFLEEKAP